MTDFCEDWPSRYAHYNAPNDHELIAPFCMPEAHPVGHPYGLTDGPYSSRRRCVGDKYVHRVMLDYARSFWANYAAYPRFAAITLVEGHEGTGDVLDTADADLSTFLDDVMLARGGVRDTVLMFVSDHGLHMGPLFLWTAQGTLEHRQPTLMLSLPSIPALFTSAKLAALATNQQRLVSAHDVHAMLRDVLAMVRERGATAEALKAADAECAPRNPVCTSRLGATGGCGDLDALDAQPRVGTSLFSVIPESRHCGDAGIALDLCMCLFDGSNVYPAANVPAL
jgi:hypothetical protein